jgi:ribosome maturation factor RimP
MIFFLKSKDIKEKLTDIVEKVLLDMDFELYDLNYLKQGKKWVLRVFIDNVHKPISLDDCELVSKKLSTILDYYDIIPESFLLEVSSPGIERKLKKDSDFNRFKGEEIIVSFKNPNLNPIIGILEGIDSEGRYIFVNTGKSEEKVNRNDIKEVRIHFRFKGDKQ